MKRPTERVSETLRITKEDTLVFVAQMLLVELERTRGPGEWRDALRKDIEARVKTETMEHSRLGIEAQQLAVARAAIAAVFVV